MRPSFLRLQSPYLAAIVGEVTPEQTINSILTCERDGAEAFVVDLAAWERDKFTRDVLASVFHCSGRPMMPLCYRSRNLSAENMDDEARAELMLLTIDAGAAACDIMGDMYDPSPRERTRDEKAIRKQKCLIDRVHAKGAEVLMSSHAQSEFIPAEDVLEHLADFVSRGVDIPKIVVRADNQDELLEAFRTTVLLKKELTAPFVHLCCGKCGRLQRYVAPTLGAALTFGVRNPGQGPQPLVSAARSVLNELNWHHDYPEAD
ncbi:MAG: type I 3-dehydroquinate dehydratase [Lentisphaerae bacterium]|jgi:3-dehydroquinate dehydratase|nr:type I 3-dehydroquinate dehydratase [Lentisphaerota bacterium]MBT4817237.1 type I 3-dehydroquinate dehydratase [Lentisphaerota bacterium]MBT5608322.1 type I 3-dehydroquinate dehydratase [Lentisphaerota bacterium]MBT7057483.1 type I 3-dehydroquinate dehydratase [Lentisphaerota bacterium]MBT7844479.1 type I 3-dehydroquinate dehydratase [Lentisphaerota bacterium]